MNKKTRIKAAILSIALIISVCSTIAVGFMHDVEQRKRQPVKIIYIEKPNTSFEALQKRTI